MALIVEKMRENKLKWYRHVTRREESEVVRITIKLDLGWKEEDWKDGVGCDWEWYEDGRFMIETMWEIGLSGWGWI